MTTEAEILAAAFAATADQSAVRMLIDRQYARLVLNAWTAWLRSERLLPTPERYSHGRR